MSPDAARRPAFVETRRALHAAMMDCDARRQASYIKTYNLPL
jgi:hypothetical protein